MSYTAHSPLLGLGQAVAAQIQAWFRKHNPNVPAELGAVIQSECSRAGVNSDLVSAQIAHETGWWTSYAATKLNNPAGVGITNDSRKINSPDSRTSPREFTRKLRICSPTSGLADT